MSFCPFPKDGDGRESSGDAAALREARETAASREAQRFPEDPQAPTGEAHGEPGPALYAKLRAMALQQAKRDQDLGTRETILTEREASLLNRAEALESRERAARQERQDFAKERAAFVEECRGRRECWQGWLCAFVITGLIELLTGTWLAYAATVWGHRG